MKTFKNLGKWLTAVCCFLFVFPAVSQDNPRLSDEEVAFIAVTANKIDINTGKLAKSKTQNEQVRGFAETMIKDHTAVIDQATELVKKAGLTPKEHAVGKQLLADAALKEKELKAKNGKSFDQAYIDHEVAFHQQVISAVDGLLIPEAENQELKTFLQNIRPALQAHLQHAEMIQKDLKAK